MKGCDVWGVEGIIGRSDTRDVLDVSKKESGGVSRVLSRTVIYLGFLLLEKLISDLPSVR